MPIHNVPTIKIPSGESVPVLGQGTWRMGENPGQRRNEVAALRLGLDLGMTLIDTAEMYADGGAEEVVAEAIAGRRDEVFVVTKFYPYNATRKGMREACERSLKRLKTDRVDLYLLHWRGAVPLAETLAGFEDLLQAGKIRYWGVSNFDIQDMEELAALPQGSSVSTDQVLYNLMYRGIEWDLLPWCRQRGIPIMAYSPIQEGILLDEPVLKTIALRHQAKPAQIALAWILRQKDMIAIPKSSSLEHLQENRGALDIQLAEEDLAEIDQVFPPPRKQERLKII